MAKKTKKKVKQSFYKQKTVYVKDRLINEVNAEFEAIRRFIANLAFNCEFADVPFILQTPNTQQINFNLFVAEIVYNILGDGECAINLQEGDDEHKSAFFLGDDVSNIDFIFNGKHLILSKIRLNGILTELNSLSNSIITGLQMSNQVFLTSDRELDENDREILDERVNNRLNRDSVVLDSSIKPQIITSSTTSQGGDNMREVYAKAIYRCFFLDFLLNNSLTPEQYEHRLRIFQENFLKPLLVYIIDKINYHYNFKIFFKIKGLN